MYNRRDFLKTGGLVIIGGLALGGNADLFGKTIKKSGYFPLPPGVNSNDVSLFNKQTFEPFLNTNFSVRRKNSAQIPMRLVEVVGSDNKKNSFNTEATDDFLLVFEVIGKERLEDKIYNIAHPELGEFSIFVSTVGRSGKRYQAVFSRVYF